MNLKPEELRDIAALIDSAKEFADEGGLSFGQCTVILPSGTAVGSLIYNHTEGGHTFQPLST